MECGSCARYRGRQEMEDINKTTKYSATDAMDDGFQDMEQENLRLKALNNEMCQLLKNIQGSITIQRMHSWL